MKRKHIFMLTIETVLLILMITLASCSATSGTPTDKEPDVQTTLSDIQTTPNEDTKPYPQPSDGLKFRFHEPDNNTCEVSGIGSCHDKDIVIPPTYKGKPVTAIGENAFRDCYNLYSITIPDSVTYIGAGAFVDCDDLKNINFGDGVTTIGTGAFSGCESLSSVTLPESVVSIGDYAFYASYLQDITFTGNVKSIGAYAFYACPYLWWITIPEGVISIGEGAFCLCEDLKSITLPDSIVSIGEFAFARTFAYNYVDSNWENGLLYIGKHLIIANDHTSRSYSVKEGTLTIADGAFKDCSKLTEITIPTSVANIGNSAFLYCTSLTNVYYNGTKAQWKQISIGSNNADLTSITIHCTDGDIN